ncbi:acetyl-CoA acetyltransferase [Tamaricihabitans halophyticus]|uniref:Acetyl-CoA acetyltransferase n=1 Tax=Tamaricihabitans halophyticus TaxID=1262583 RepID=A0A4R2R0R6_9PSEU|nr:thiolase family protein [Tamaricihabitans halophyticus]TCP55048.1 acetyl-CoA acetyltransferase [Tamaricihabitans halophyticus]
MSEVAITGAAESPYTRHPPRAASTETVLVDAARRAVADAGITLADVDGLGVASFTLRPDHAVDLAWRMGLRLNWIMEDTNGGASGVNLLQHAVRAVQAGDARTILLIAGDRMAGSAFAELVAEYNIATRDHLTPLPAAGPNPLFAMLTKRHMAEFGLDRQDYGQIVLAQRDWARHNPGAVYRTPLSIADYLDAPLVADPLHRYDCVPPVTGADALVVTAADRAAGRGVAVVRAIGGIVNADGQESTGLRTGLGEVAPEVWRWAGVGPADLDLVCVYDDYPVMVAIQLTELGLVAPENLRRFLYEDLRQHRLPINTTGGQLSAGQAGAAGGMHGLVEAAIQLRGEAGERSVPARIAAVTGYGMVLYRHGACANLAVLEGR